MRPRSAHQQRHAGHLLQVLVHQGAEDGEELVAGGVGGYEALGGGELEAAFPDLGDQGRHRAPRSRVPSRWRSRRRAAPSSIFSTRWRWLVISGPSAAWRRASSEARGRSPGVSTQRVG